MYKDMAADKLMDMIYHEVHDNITDDICRECPLVEFLGEIRHTIKDMTHEQIMHEIGVYFSDKKCPCVKDRDVRSQ